MVATLTPEALRALREAAGVWHHECVTIRAADLRALLAAHAAATMPAPSRKHAAAVACDAVILMTHERMHVAAVSRAAYYPGPDADYSASGCIDAPAWIPAGSCGLWRHSGGDAAGMLVIPREGGAA